MTGNDPKRWERLLEYLDDKLQLGLLEQLRRVESYHFEGDTLFIVAGQADVLAYLQKPAVAQQLQILAETATGVTQVEARLTEA